MLIAALLALAIAEAPVAAPAAAPEVPVSSPAKVPWAVQYDLPSKITGRTYRIYVAKPVSPPPKGGWPVVYVLDADINFPSVAAQMVMRSVSGQRAAIIVGVAYPNAIATMSLRNRDLTPSQPTPWTESVGGFPSPNAKDFGGADDFHRFMMEELRPRIATAYPADAADQSLMGYSLGGLFALRVLFHHPEAYRTYVVGSPSIWWNQREVLGDEAAFAAAVRAGKTAPRILVTSDRWEQDSHSPEIPASGAERAAALKEMDGARMVDNARELASRLASLHGGKDYRVRYVLFPEETHLTGMPASGSRGLVFALTP
ncbi:alpha/beta hydrolase [Phenylobacterium sp.]|uniref:alpha/beta hydrolase n=1 Tax=Phenylobacterium sp. TaxID=1871053 RepID=UPI00374CD472